MLHLSGCIGAQNIDICTVLIRDRLRNFSLYDQNISVWSVVTATRIIHFIKHYCLRAEGDILIMHCDDEFLKCLFTLKYELRVYNALHISRDRRLLFSRRKMGAF